MATRTRRKWKADPRGYYSRQIGWVLTPSGKKQQHKFLLGKVQRDAEHRERKLRELWDRYAAGIELSQPLWPADLLELAKLVARGVEEVSVAMRPGESPLSYASRIRALQATHPIALFVPVNQYIYDVGSAALHGFGQLTEESRIESVNQCVNHVTQFVRDSLVGESLIRDSYANEPQSGNVTSGRGSRPHSVIGTHLSCDTEPGSFLNHVQIASEAARVIPNYARLPENPMAEPLQLLKIQNDVMVNRQSLHEAFTAYQEFIKREFYRPELDELTAWGQTPEKTDRIPQKSIMKIVCSPVWMAMQLMR